MPVRLGVTADNGEMADFIENVRRKDGYTFLSVSSIFDATASYTCWYDTHDITTAEDWEHESYQ